MPCRAMIRAALLTFKDCKQAEATLHRGKLAPWQVRRVCEHMRAHLDQDVTLAELASTFGTAFRRMTGIYWRRKTRP